MATASTEGMKPGPQQPGKYPRVGKNYLQWGEQQGYVYYWPNDQYYVNPKTIQSQYEQEGLIEKEPGMAETLAPIAAVGGTMALANKTPEILKGAGEGVKGLLSAGKEAAATEQGVAGAANGEVLGAAVEAGNSGSGIASSEAANASWNAGADAATAESTSLAGTEGMGGIMANAGQMGPLPIAAVVGATALGGRFGLRALQGKTKNWKDSSLADNAGRATLALATGGLSEVGNKIFGGHKSTRDRQQGKINEYVKSGAMPQELAGEYGIIQDMGVDDRKLGSGLLGAKDVWGVSGMFDTFGKDWLGTYTEAEREQIAQRLLDEKLLDSRKGLTRIIDPERAKQIADEIRNKNKPQSKGLLGA